MYNLGHQAITSLSSAQSLTVPAGATVAVVDVETKSVRWRGDGTAPTSTVGKIIGAGSERTFDGQNIKTLQFIETSASAAINVVYYGPSNI